MHQAEPVKSSLPESEGGNEDGDDLLEVSVRSFCTQGGFSLWYRPTCGRARLFTNLTTTRLVTRLVIVAFLSYFRIDAARVTIPSPLFQSS